jgi:predicted nucleic acid-binding protein
MTKTSSRQLVLDAGALIALARGNAAARAIIRRALRRGYKVMVPTPVVAQVHRGGWDRTSMDRALKAVDVFPETSLETAMRAGVLLGRTGLTDAVDAIVVAEASNAHTTIVTSDRDDIGRLVDADDAGRDVYVEAV